MIIKREYTLPNCTLTVSGMSQEGGSSESGSDTPAIDSILSAEFKFLGLETSLSGEKEFFENAIASISDYAQQFLSGLRYPKPNPKDRSNTIEIEQVDNKNLHRLSWQPPDKEKVEIELTTIQLFDLVEAIDQFFADRLTLPDLQLKLKPLPRRYRTSDEPLTKRSAPAALGLASLAVSGLVLFITPIPERSKEVDPQPTNTEQKQEEDSNPPETSTDPDR
ncbi:MAG: DUF4335 domain-containing protein [Prochloraceae cyanobacterium]|nr:DUF4335 domain-containing protein [Prochloraceae cyanobacterium]